jgi:integrase
MARKDVDDYSFPAWRRNPIMLPTRGTLRFIKALFNHGVERDLLSGNPAEKIKFFPIARNKKYLPPQEDIDKVFNYCTEEQRSYLLAIITTMARISELNKLKWEDIHDDYLILIGQKSKNSGSDAKG